VSWPTGLPVVARSGGHWQTPATQAAAHTVPHMPQLLASTWVSVQTPPQSVKPPAVSQTQLPAVHTSVAAQVVVHSPQCAGSCWVLVQTPLQSTNPFAWSHTQLEPPQI